MSIAHTASAWQMALASTTCRNFGRAVALAFLAVGVGVAVYLVETFGLGLKGRFMESPADVMMRALAIAHFLVGALFLFTSPKLRNGPAVARLVFCTAAGIGICLVFAAYGAVKNPYLLMLFYSYFLVHEIRDETAIFQAYGDAPRHGTIGQELLGRIRWAATITFMTLLGASYAVYVQAAGKPTALDHLPPAALPLFLTTLFMAGAWSWHRVFQKAREIQEDARLLLITHLPLLLVYGGILGILLAGSFFGSTGFNLIILIHVTAWIVFVSHQLGNRPRREKSGLWNWLRRTPAGFLTLHLGLALVVLILMAVRVHVWHRLGLVSEFLASSNFVYWGLMHISMAFWSGK